jgi:hypothetical protein
MLWMLSLRNYHIVVLACGNKYPWFQLPRKCNLWIEITKIPSYELNLVPSQGSYSFETHFWASHSDCWGMFSLTDVKRRMESMLGNALVSCPMHFTHFLGSLMCKTFSGILFTYSVQCLNLLIIKMYQGNLLLIELLRTSTVSKICQSNACIPSDSIHMKSYPSQTMMVICTDVLIFEMQEWYIFLVAG